MTLAKAAKTWSIPGIAVMLAALPLAQINAQDGAAAAGDLANGKLVFENSVCGACHVLAAADATGPIGPSLDNNANLTHAFIADRVANGAGAMPPYAAQLSEKDINDVAAYILSAAAKPE